MNFSHQTWCVGLASVIVEYVADNAEGRVDKFYENHNYERVFLEGAANGAVAGALGDSIANPGILAFGLTIAQDLGHDTGHLPANAHEFANIFSDALTQAIIAEVTFSAGPSLIDADGLAKGKKLLPEFLSGEANTYVAMGLGLVYGTSVGTVIKEYFDMI